MYSTTYYGEYGGCFVPELLMPPLLEVDQAMRDILPTKEFQNELHDLLFNYAGRPTPLTFCPNLSKELGFNLWLKREDLLHTGAHKMNNTLGQALLAKKMGKTALIAETGAGQHGVATATAAAQTAAGMGFQCFLIKGFTPAGAGWAEAVSRPTRYSGSTLSCGFFFDSMVICPS